MNTIIESLKQAIEIQSEFDEEWEEFLSNQMAANEPFDSDSQKCRFHDELIKKRAAFSKKKFVTKIQELKDSLNWSEEEYEQLTGTLSQLRSITQETLTSWDYSEE